MSQVLSGSLEGVHTQERIWREEAFLTFYHHRHTQFIWLGSWYNWLSDGNRIFAFLLKVSAQEPYLRYLLRILIFFILLYIFLFFKVSAQDSYLRYLLRILIFFIFIYFILFFKVSAQEPYLRYLLRILIFYLSIIPVSTSITNSSL